MNLSEPFITRPVMTAVLTVSVILFGILSYLQLPVNDLPAVDYPVIQVQASYPAQARIRWRTISPLHSSADSCRSTASAGNLAKHPGQHQSHIAVRAGQKHRRRRNRCADCDLASDRSLPIDLPSPPTYSKTNPNDQPIMYIALTSDSVTRGQLYDFGSTQVGQRISILPGVSRVDVFGTKSAIRIKTDPSAMWARGISVDDLTAAIRNGTSYTGAGQFDSSLAHRFFAEWASSRQPRDTAIYIGPPRTEPRSTFAMWRKFDTPSRTNGST